MNSSLKVFPVVLSEYEAGIRHIVEGVKKIGLPIIVLTRRLDHAHGSLMTAKESKVWNELSRNGTAGERRGADENDPKFQAYRSRIGTFFERSRKLLNESDVKMFDEFDYDEVKGTRYIVAQKSRCYIHNCNFQIDNLGAGGAEIP